MHQNRMPSLFLTQHGFTTAGAPFSALAGGAPGLGSFAACRVNMYERKIPSLVTTLNFLPPCANRVSVGLCVLGLWATQTRKLCH